jgi:hypothetical protein
MLRANSLSHRPQVRPRLPARDDLDLDSQGRLLAAQHHVGRRLQARVPGDWVLGDYSAGCS